MRRPRIRYARGMGTRLCCLVAAAVLSIAAAGCGFDDQLTPRGFIKEGDTLCAGALIKARTDAGAAASQGFGQEAIVALAQGYSTIADGLRKLDVADVDETMRDAMVKNYADTAARIRTAAASAGAGDPNAANDAFRVIADIQPFLVTVREYGFKACGDRSNADPAA